MTSAIEKLIDEACGVNPIASASWHYEEARTVLRKLAEQLYDRGQYRASAMLFVDAQNARGIRSDRAMAKSLGAALAWTYLSGKARADMTEHGITLARQRSRLRVEGR